MTQPALATATERGRLYRRPTTPEGSWASVEGALQDGTLMPSVTNIIDVLGKPYLQTWYAKRTAEDAIKVNGSHPGLMEAKPRDAVKWLSAAATRTMETAAALGDEVHNAVEALAAGTHVEVSNAAAGYVHAWEKFVTDFHPRFLHLEATCFGVVNSPSGPLHYAGTADAIIEVNGKVLIIDYKTGRSVHTDAALQLSALAYAKEMVGPEGDLQPMVRVNGAAVLHLMSNGYEFRPVTDIKTPWAEFSKLRSVWDFHQSNLNSKGPLFIGEPIHPVDPSDATA